MRSSLHVPVLLEETMDFLGVNREGIYVDCTIG
ncbi:MAG: 16S rRNA (cytosine(1402)-N(4))-methyltransferase, partial [Candidatus Aminicenantes bacterium]|nr:16S rRNA (cytosine(1402)-N(4))-methyltransferase [Candidatus Aminicenantes bacterium]